MKNLYLILFAIGFMQSAVAADVPLRRVSLFSTTVDWAAVTGLSLRQYNGEFIGSNPDLTKKGLTLYYLDAFPCYGEADSVRVWLDTHGKTDDKLRLVCIHEPQSIKFAWHNMDKDAVQSVTTGVLTCPVVTHSRSFTIDISKCVKGPDWQEFE